MPATDVRGQSRRESSGSSVEAASSAASQSACELGGKLHNLCRRSERRFGVQPHDLAAETKDALIPELDRRRPARVHARRSEHDNVTTEERRHVDMAAEVSLSEENAPLRVRDERRLRAERAREISLGARNLREGREAIERPNGID